MKRGRDGNLVVYTALFVLLIDRIAKMVVHTFFRDVTFNFWVFDIHYVTNTGAAFSMLSGRNALLTVVSLVAFAALIYLLKDMNGSKYMNVAKGMLFGGAFANLVDRLIIGHVVDFIDFHVWPIFNFADVGICLGTAFIVLKLLLEKEPVKESTSSVA